MRRLLLIVFVLLLQQAKANEPDSTISCKVSGLTFDKFCETIYLKSGVRVYYKSDWVIGLRVSLDEDEITVFDAVSSAIEGTQLKVSVWNNALVLLPDQQLYSELPVFETKLAESQAEAENSADITQSEERYLTGRKPEVIQRITIGEPGKHSGRKPAKVQGRVLDQETGEPVFYATVFVEETQTGAVTDVNGFFTLLLKPGNYNIKFDFMGYELKKYQLNVLSDGSFSIQLKKTVYQIEEFVVYGDRQRSMKEKDPGLDKISMRSVKALPMLMGERDILKVSGTLPGIVSVGEGTSGLNVRGGGADQNAFYINSIPIFNPTHLFGFFPAFNSDIIKDFSAYKGHIPAAYGGRLSSVFNIITRRGNRKNFTAHGGISPISANLVVEGPIKKESVSVLLSTRSTYSDWILQRVNDPDI
ncbi:MAG: TonB-dependent receptor, partial [Bacteroidales bacterium]|nr:TonB-dependent receptor [Bacteroidales bacterium]